MSQNKYSQLAWKIHNEKDPARLAKIIEGNKIAKVGVHPFIVSEYRAIFAPPEKIGKLPYDRYILDVARLFENEGRFSNSVFIFENSSSAPRIARKEFDSAGVEFIEKNPSFYSSSGSIIEYAKPNGQYGNGKAHARKNYENKAYERMCELFCESDGVFVFGLFGRDCVSRAVRDIKISLKELGRDVRVYQSDLTTKNLRELF